MTAKVPWAAVQRLFELAVALEPGERDAFLAGSCDDPALRRELDALLVADASARDLLAVQGVARPIADRLGPYRVIRTLGEGETSTVYLAERDDGQYRQQVAIKLVRQAMASRQIVLRFEQERRILAGLAHPNIARLFDGGATPDGQPYFVMEYIDGLPLDVHCQDGGLPLARRLELFIAICQAVHFAHRNLIVHRDLKPGNILVGADGIPKLLDFGIAKLLDLERDDRRAERTATIARLMTPEYASPEQVLGQPVSTASDVYSLGVILYKLLTGRRPYELASRALRDIERAVCEVTPPAPSEVVRAGHRGALPIDLDHIALMALRKEPDRRYASAQELGDDVRRFLERRPVLARRGVFGYLVWSFVRRNAGAVIAAAVILLSVIGGAIATTWQWRHAVAEQARAEAQRLTAERTLDFVIELFKVEDSPVPLREVTARELLDRGAAQLRVERRDGPELRAALAHTLGVVYRNLGDYAKATALLDEAVALRVGLPGGELELADSLYQLGAVSAENGKPYEAEPLLRRALAIRGRVLGDDAPAVADVLEKLGDNVSYHVPFQEAEDDLRRALAIRQRHLAPDSPQLIASIVRLADLYSKRGRYPEADALFRRVQAAPASLPDPESCRMLADALGLLRYAEGYFDQAAGDIDTAVECVIRARGPDHVDVADAISVRVPIWREQGRYAEAEALGRRSLAARRALHGDRHPAVDNALYHLAGVLYERGKLAEATELASSSLAMRERAYGRVHDSVARSLALLADLQLASGDAATAEASYREALAIWRQTMDDDHPIAAPALRGLAQALSAQGRPDDARQVVEQALALQRRRLRPGHPAIAGTLIVLGSILELRDPAAAEPLFREAVAIRRAALPPSHPHTARAESALGECLALEHETDVALPLLRHAVDVLRAQLGADHPETQRALQRLRAWDAPTF